MRWCEARYRGPLLLGLTLALAGGARADDGLVIVNGQTIPRQRVVELAMEAHGLAAMQQLIVLELARQESARRGITVSAAEVDAEFRSALQRMGASGDGDVTDEDRRRALDLLLEQKGVSLAEFMVGMERNAHLRKVVESGLKITEQTLREEFARTYGERVRIRHIELADTDAVRTVTEALNQGLDFAEAARRFSRNVSAERGGELAPFPFDDGAVPPVLREAAFSMQPGEVSNPIRVDQQFHLIRLEERLPSESAKFEDVRNQVEERLRERVIPQEMARLATELFQKARVKVLDPKLKSSYDELLRKSGVGAAP